MKAAAKTPPKQIPENFGKERPVKAETRMAIRLESRMEKDPHAGTVYETVGCLRRRGGVSSLSFTEEHGDGQKSLCTLSLDSDVPGVRVRRRGGIRCEMVFRPGEAHTSVYEIAPYRFDITVRSHEIKASLCEEGGEILLRYEREIGGERDLVRFRLTATPLKEEEPHDGQ